MALDTHAPPSRRAMVISTAIGAEALVNALIFVAILSSFVVFIEPAPYEGFVFLVAAGLCFAGLKLDRLLVPLIVLLTLWAVSGAFALMPVMGNPASVTYYAVTVYLEFSAFVFACTFSDNTERRLETLKRAYILAAVLASMLGIIGYFNLVPGARTLMLENDRARATFKDPNVFGPFLILPLLFLVQEFIYRGFRLRHILSGGLILIGLFLSFSRGAWGHAVGSALFMLALMFWTNRDGRFRRRLIGLSIAAAIGITVMLMILLSFSAVREMFLIRAHLTNYYDNDTPTGRFGRQLEGFLSIFDHPNGLGPKYFGITFGQDPHNVYLATLYAQGWVGGFAYLALVVTTLVLGFRALMVRTPWQPALIATYATFLGVVLEGFIIDTDHWRHYFLLLGMVWGLSIASLRRRDRPAALNRT